MRRPIVRNGFAVVVLALCLFVPRPGYPAPAPIASERLIVPGERIGPAQLARLDELQRIYGGSDQTDDQFWNEATTHLWTRAALLAVADNASGNVLWISVGSTTGPGRWAELATREGIGFASTEQQIIAAMGRPTTVTQEPEPVPNRVGFRGRDLFYHHKGISFSLALDGPRAGRVAFIDVFWALQAAGDSRVIPGARIGSVALGMDVNQVGAAMTGGWQMVRLDTYTTVPHPQVGDIRVGSIRVGTFQAAWAHTGVNVFFSNWHAFQISARWANSLDSAGVRYATPQGIGWNSTAGEVLAAFGEPTERQVWSHRSRNDSEAWIYASVGLAVVIGGRSHYARPGRVVGITVLPVR